MSDNGVTIEQIADLVGHRRTIVTQKVYRHQLKPVISTGATTMNTIFGNKKSAWRRLTPVSAFGGRLQETMDGLGHCRQVAISVRRKAEFPRLSAVLLICTLEWQIHDPGRSAERARV